MNSIFLKIIRKLANTRYIGKLVRILVGIWRGPETRSAVIDIESKQESILEEFKSMFDGFGAAVKGLERTNKRHEISFAKLKEYFEEGIDNIYVKLGNETNQSLDKLASSFENEFSIYKAGLNDIAKRVGWIEADNENIRERIEFIREELFFELRKQLRIKQMVPNNTEPYSPRVVNKEKVYNTDPKKLNLGCGARVKEDYINVDFRDLPGVDVISDVAQMPFEKLSIDKIYASHLLEHFTEQTLLDSILPHWFELLRVGGELVLIVPDSESMVDAYVKGKVNFNDLRDVIFGGQEYDGDFHYTMFAKKELEDLLKVIGFSQIEMVFRNRKNGICLDMEFRAVKPNI